ncbi:MAG: glycosyltransferase family 4 protein [Halobacteriota archaeon]|nr:glycosyltransferase family 4 protein [Halobacteriota archaeon]
MRIGFFVWEYPPRIVGGLGTYAQNITPEFIAMGHDISLFTLNPGDLLTREVLKGVEVHRPELIDACRVFPLFVREDLRKWGTQLQFFCDVFTYNILSAAKFINQLIKKDKYDFDIICVHDWLSSIAGVGIKQELKGDMPFVFHVHSTEWGRALDTGSATITHLEDTAAQVSDRVITVSYPMQEDLVRHGWDAHKISVCWNGVNPDTYNIKNIEEKRITELREHYGITDKEKMILFVGRLTAVKGATQLVQGMPEVLRENPDAKLVILGSGELDNTIADLIKRLGIEKNVKTCFEFVCEEDRIAHIAACDLAVYPSLYEPFGIVSLEAMAMEKPIVIGAKGVSGFRDQVIPSGPRKTGVHVDGGSPTDIAWGINSILEDPEEAVRMGKRGRMRVEEYFTWEKAAKYTLDVYKGVIKSMKK